MQADIMRRPYHYKKVRARDLQKFFAFKQELKPARKEPTALPVKYLHKVVDTDMSAFQSSEPFTVRVCLPEAFNGRGATQWQLLMLWPIHRYTHEDVTEINCVDDERRPQRLTVYHGYQNRALLREGMYTPAPEKAAA
jgi:hypothetical protein